MEKQLKVNGHPVFELGGDLFSLEFPRDGDMSAYLHWRLCALPKSLGLHLWQRLRDPKEWKRFAKVDPILEKYEDGLVYIKSLPTLRDLAGFAEEPSLVQRIVGNEQGLGCFLFSSEYLSSVSDSKGNYGFHQKLIEVRGKTDSPVISSNGYLIWNFRPMLVPLKRETMIPDTVLFQKSNPNGMEITGGVFTLNGRDIRKFKGPLNRLGLESLCLEETDNPADEIHWFAWNGRLFSMDVLFQVLPKTILEYIGRP